MARTNQNKKDNWERKHVQRVLDYHNEKYGAHIEIRGKTQDICPELKGKSDWDWVCDDTETGDKIAVEVKRITKQELEKKAQAIYNLLHEIRMSLLNLLTGEFVLSVDIPNDYSFPLRGQPKNKQMLKDVISKAIIEASQRLDIRETEDLVPQISEKLPFKLPNIMFFDLHKLDNRGNILVLNIMIDISCSIGFGKLELEKFNDLVSWANTQLKAARTKETFLVLIEEGYRPIDPLEITEGFTGINAESYSEIRHVYFIRGEEVAEIPLPTIP